MERRRGSIALGLLVSAQFVVMLDTSIVNVALPSIQADLGLSPTGLTWVVNAYVLAFGGLLLLSGRAADLLGRRRCSSWGPACSPSAPCWQRLQPIRVCSWPDASSRASAPLHSAQPRCRCSS